MVAVEGLSEMPASARPGAAFAAMLVHDTHELGVDHIKWQIDSSAVTLPCF
jgi:hypothetical protein